jgi:hypothetical protein
MIQLARHQLALVRRGPEREPRHVRQVRHGRRHHHEQDDEGERQNLPRAERQTHSRQALYLWSLL